MRRIALLLVGCLLVESTAGVAAVPKGDSAAAPTAQQVIALQAEAARTGWTTVAQKLRAIAVSRFEQSAPQAQAWYYLYRWADLFSATEAQAVANWADNVNRANARYPGVGPDLRAGEQSLADLWPEELRIYAMASPDFSDQFFTLLSPLDQPVMVMKILAAIWRQNPAGFKEYANLALAIAVVHDVPPPPDWPHGQVSVQALPRRLPPPADVFAFFTKADRAGVTLQRLRRLPASELKFVVDTSATFADLEWAQTNVQTPLAGLARLYDIVRYRRDRLESDSLMWPKETYSLPVIVKEGGICVDQAYFAATVGKAKGVPTLLFRGAGLDGRHAWFGFLDGNNRWQLDCGRFAEQKLVTGVAFDPQTWMDISDHELAFLAEGFRRLPLFAASRMNAQFAELYFNADRFSAAIKAARAAVNIEPRNLEAWNMLLMAQQKLSGDPKPFEALLQEGARAFQRYPDVEAGFKILFSRSLRARGETTAADFAERSAAQKYSAGREDLSVRQAQEILQRSMSNDDLDDRILTYYRVLKSYGSGAGIDFFDRIVRPFVEHLLENGRAREAMQAVERARGTLRVEPNTQLETNLNVLAEKAQQAAR